MSSTAAAADVSVGFTWWMLVAGLGGVLAGAVYLLAKLGIRGTPPQLILAVRQERPIVLNIALIDMVGGLIIAVLVAVTKISGPLAWPNFVNQYPFWGWLLMGALGPGIADHTFVGRLVNRANLPGKSQVQETTGSIARAREASVALVVARLYMIIEHEAKVRNNDLKVKIPKILRSSPRECENLVAASNHYFEMTKQPMSSEVKNYISLCRRSIKTIPTSLIERDGPTPEDVFERSLSLARRLLDEGHWRPVAVIADGETPTGAFREE